MQFIAAVKRLAADHGRFIVALLRSICVNHPQRLGEWSVDDLYKELYTSASFDVLIPGEPARSYMSNTRDPQPVPFNSGCNMGIFLAAVMTRGLQLRSPEVNQSLVEKCKLGANARMSKEPESIYLPFVKELLAQCGRLEVGDSMKALISKIVTGTLLDLIVACVSKQPSSAAAQVTGVVPECLAHAAIASH